MPDVIQPDVNQDAATIKAAIVDAKSAGVTAVKVWRHTTRATAEEAAAFLNESPAQVAGEACLANRADGTVDVYFFM
jgi:hypothetical protein